MYKSYIVNVKSIRVETGEDEHRLLQGQSEKAPSV